MSGDPTANTSAAVFLLSWQALEDGLTMIAATPELEGLVPETISALRKAQASGDSPSRLLLRILCATAYLANGSADLGALSGDGAMT